MSILTSLAPVSVITYALNLLLHLTILCLIVLGVSRWFFRREPAARHTLCLAGLICLLLAPVAVGLEAKAGFGLITLALPSTDPAAPVAEPAEKGDLVLVPVEKPYRVAISATLSTQPATSWRGWAVLAAYLLGVSFGVLRFAHGCRKAFRLKRDVSPWRAPSDSAALRTVEQALRAPLPPVFTSPHVASPIAIGLLHPAVILPDGLAETLTPQQLRHVLLHECAHVAFRHGLGGLLERIAGVLFWPHPLVRALCRELARAREEVCDNFASQEDGAPCYARTLLLVAQGFDIAPNLASTLALLGTGTSLEARISGLLDPRRNRMVSLKRWKLWAVTGAVVVAMGSTAAIRVVAAQEKAAQNPGGVLPGGNAVTQIFKFQFIEANEAAEILYNSVTPEQAQQINLSVDSRTNSIIVVSSEPGMVAIATLFGRLEAQAALERAQQDQVRVPSANTEAQIARQQAAAEAQLVQAQQAVAQAQSVFSTQNRVQTGSVPTPQPNTQTRFAVAVKSAPAPTGPSKEIALKMAVKQRQLDLNVQLAGKRAAVLSAKQGTKVKASNVGTVPRGEALQIQVALQSAFKAADGKTSRLQDRTQAKEFLTWTRVSQSVPVSRQDFSVWPIVPDQKSQINATTSGTNTSKLKSLPKSTVPNGKSTQKRFEVITQTSSPTFTEVISKISMPNFQVLPTSTTFILKSADAQAVKMLLAPTVPPVQTPSQHTTGAPSKASATTTKQQFTKPHLFTALDQLELRAATEQLDKATVEKVQYSVALKSANQKIQDADAVKTTTVLQAAYDRLMSLQMVKEADEKLIALTAAQAFEEAARRQVEKNPK